MLKRHDPTTVTIPNAVASRRDEKLFVVRAPNGHFVAESGVTVDFEKALILDKFEEADDLAEDREWKLRSSGAPYPACIFTVERLARTYVISDVQEDYWAREDD